MSSSEREPWVQPRRYCCPSGASTSALSAWRGSGPEPRAIERVAADATYAGRLTELATGAAALYNCASPPYHQWFTDRPPLARAFLAAAERSDAVLASMSNLYGYGPHGRSDYPTRPRSPRLTPSSGCRAEMWNDQLAAQEAGRIRTTEVRASDYIELGELDPVHGDRQAAAGREAGVRALAAGRAAQLDLDPRLRPDPGHGRRRRAGLRAGLAGADQPAAFDRAPAGGQVRGGQLARRGPR